MSHLLPRSRSVRLVIPDTALDSAMLIATVAQITMKECRTDAILHDRLGAVCTLGGFLFAICPLDCIRSFAVLAETSGAIPATVEEIVASHAAWLNLKEAESAQIAVRSVRSCAHAWLVMRDGSVFDPAVRAGMTPPLASFYESPDAIVVA